MVAQTGAGLIRIGFPPPGLQDNVNIGFPVHTVRMSLRIATLASQSDMFPLKYRISKANPRLLQTNGDEARTRREIRSAKWLSKQCTHYD